MSLERESAQHTIHDVILPIESFGMCTNHRNCKNYHVQLGNGYCVQCYDRGLERHDQNHKQEREKNPHTVDYYYAQKLVGRRRRFDNSVERE